MSGLLATPPRRGGEATAFLTPGPFKPESREQCWTKGRGVQLPPAHPVAHVQLSSLSLHHQICKMKRTPACLGLIHPWVFSQPLGSNMSLPARAPNKVGQRRSKEKGSGLVGEPWVYRSLKSPGPMPGAGPQMEPQQEARGRFPPGALRVKAGSLGAGPLPEGSPVFPGGLWWPSPLLPGSLYPGQVSSALGILPRAWPSWEQQPLWIPLCRKNGVPILHTQ